MEPETRCNFLSVKKFTFESDRKLGNCQIDVGGRQAPQLFHLKNKHAVLKCQN
jgi:hypothetical protein